MTISYPITPPVTTGQSNIKLYQKTVVAISASPFTYQQQVQQHEGEKWVLSVAIDPLVRSEAAPWYAFLAKLRGKRGTFYWGDVNTATPQGAVGGTPLVKGAAQTGYVLLTDGWTPGAAILKAGDFFQIGTSLYLNLVDVSADGSGNASLDIWPAIRGHADNAPIITSNPVGVFRLVEDMVPIVDVPQNQAFNIYFNAEEAL